ncbi:Kinase-related protein of unknown function (DUF1296 [Striga hermonthica]|uniref:GBF-interacting protein 1 N-terminal domain-containing protein n=1 Tax=Striga hermonthica TaxID=68872 RepID=A0A9N7N0R1_STRHE|nr:Kinase-related protein of unknown function (DUF1296 [Striga hermonthica]
MSASRGSGAGNGGGAQSVPAGSRKIVQSLKEIVNYSDAEIYATLKDCNMDPNETVNRLLAQDPFHEVKSKREKKKEGKDTTEPRSRGVSHNSSRGNKISTDQYLNIGGSTSYNSSEYAPLHGKVSSKKENGSTSYTNPFSSYDTPGNNTSRGPADHSDDASAENKGSSAAPSGVKPYSGNQSSWTGPPGPVSMADIVRMGRPQNRVSIAPTNEEWPSIENPEDHKFEDPESGISMVQHSRTNEEWPSIENPTATQVYIPEYIVDTEQYQEAHGVPVNSIGRPSEGEDVQEVQDEDAEYSGVSNSISSRKIPEDGSRSASLFENHLYTNRGSYQHDFNEAEENGASVSSVTRNLQQLDIEKGDRDLPPEGYTTSVVIPDHLQVQNVDCSHLSFGSFGPKSALLTQSNLEEPRNEPNVSSVGNLNSRSSEYYVDDSLTNASDGDLFLRSNTNAGSYAPSSPSQREELKPENAESVHSNQYTYPPDTGYTFADAQHLNAPFGQGYSNPLPSTLSPANVHAGREPDLQFSQFAGAKSLSAKYGNSASTIDGSAFSEALKTAAGFSSSSQHNAPQILSEAGVPNGPPLPQHLSMHPYSQAALQFGLGPYGNMTGYSYLPQSYTYVPSSAFQQTFSGNSTYRQSKAGAVLPQYKNSVSGGSLPQSASGYGGLGNTSMNISMNSPSSGTSLSYDDVLSTQYKDNSHLVSLQQNDNLGTWLHGLNSRTMSGLPASTYYNYHQQEQNQQTGGLRQVQQQNYGNQGYSNYYHSQGGAFSLDQQQNPRDGSLGGSQGQPKQSRIWQGGY